MCLIWMDGVRNRGFQPILLNFLASSVRNRQNKHNQKAARKTKMRDKGKNVFWSITLCCNGFIACAYILSFCIYFWYVDLTWRGETSPIYLLEQEILNPQTFVVGDGKFTPTFTTIFIHCLLTKSPFMFATIF